MKQRLLSLLAVCALSISSFAQWTAPVEPEIPIQGEEFVADGTTAYYLYNVGCGQFVLGANAWATQISLSTDGMPYMEVVVEETNDPDTHPETVMLKLNGEFKFTGGNGRTDYPVSNTYLMRENGGSGFIDWNNNGCRYFTFTQTENQSAITYYWQVSTGNDKGWDSANEYTRGAGAGQPLAWDATIEADNIEWMFVNAATLSSADVQAYKVLKDMYDARKALYDKLLEAVEYGVSTDAAGAVYNNADATIEDLNAALAALTPEVARAAVLALIPQSSQENPLDITKYTIENPDFSNGQSPWTITEGMGQNLQVQSATYKNESVEPVVVIQNFIESWIPAPNSLKDGVICQVVRGLPEGRYRIEADVMAVQQSGEITIDEMMGIYLFYNNGDYTVHSESLATENNIPEHFTFDFDYSGAAEMTIGLMTENTNCNWMGMDNFRLYAIGECQDSPAWTALCVEYNAAASYLEQEPKAQASIIEALENAKDAAEDLVNSPSDKGKDAEYTTALNAIKDAKAAVVASEAAYKTFENFIARLEAEDETYAGKAGYEAFAETVIEPLLEDCNAAYDDGTWSAEQIEAAIAEYEPKAKAWTQQLFDNAVASGETLAEPIDITALFEHMDFAYTTSQVAFADGYPAPVDSLGIVAVWQNETKTGNFKTNFSTAEVWDARPFNIYREFNNLPKGRYTIQTHAFFRVEGNDGNISNWLNDPEYGKGMAYLYMGENRANILNNAAIATDDQERAEALSMQLNEANGVYVPNSQQSGSKVFADAELAEQTLVEVSGNVLNDGDVLRVGVAGTNELQGNHWVLWTGFSLLYHGAISADALNKDLQALIDAAAEANDHGVAEGQEKLAQAIGTGEAALNGSADDKIAAMTAIREAIAYTETSGELVTKLTDLVQIYETKMYELEGSYTLATYPELVDEVNNAIGAEEFESNAAIQTWIDRLQNEWVDYILSDELMELATADAPTNMSALITNASFDNSWDGWTYSTSRGTPSIQDGSGNCAEFWSTGTFDIYQELPKLTEGYWRLEVDALYRPGNSGDVTAALNVPDSVLLDNEFFYATATGLNTGVKVMPWQDIVNGAVQFTLADQTANVSEENPAIYSDENQDLMDLIGSGLNCKSDRYDFTAPNDRAGFKNFVSAGRYINGFNFKYEASMGAIKFGLRLEDDITVGSCWCPFDDFRLLYLGTEEPDAVRDINATEANSLRNAAIFSIDGRQQQKLQRGINIVRGANGKVQKVLVK